MPTIIFTQPDGTATEVELAESTNVMRAAVTRGVPGIVGECGGQAMCATCHVYVDPADAAQLPAIADDEEEMLDCTTAPRSEFSRLGCQISVGAGQRLHVSIPSDQV